MAAQIELSPALRGRRDLLEELKAPYLKTWRDGALDAQFAQLAIDLSIRRDTRASASSDNKEETVTLAVVGDSGAGKSRTLDRAFERNRLILGRPLEELTLRVSMPAPATLRTWGLKMMWGLGCPMDDRTKQSIVWPAVKKRLIKKEILIIRIDEFQNVTKTANRDELDEIRATLKDMMVDLDHPVGLVLSGLRTFLPHLEVETEISRRTRTVDLLPISLPADRKLLAKAFETLTEVAGITVSETTVRAIGPRLLHAASNQLGESVKLIRNATELAHRQGKDELTLDQFAADYLFRKASVDSANPFLAKDWRKVDVTSVAVREGDGPKQPEKRKKRGA